MRELKALREGWDTIVVEETRLLRGLSIQGGMRDLLRLQETLEPQMQQTAHLFASDRWAALAELQSRLRRLAEWQVQNGQSVHIDSEPPKTSG